MELPTHPERVALSLLSKCYEDLKFRFIHQSLISKKETQMRLALYLKGSDVLSSYFIDVKRVPPPLQSSMDELFFSS